MKFYQIVKSVAQIGQGEVISIDEKQYKRRAQFVTVVKKPRKDGDRYVARTNKILDFKVGEIVGLDSKPPKTGNFLEVEPAMPSAAMAAA